MKREPVPGTIRATATLLEGLPTGGECWFWITGGPSERDCAAPAFLHLVPTDGDPEGEAFRSELPLLYKRFAKSFDDAICGLLSRSSADKLLFSTQDERVQRFPAQIKALVDRYGVEFPALRSL